MQYRMSSSHHHDEYTDYSCSTSVERLARDVETLLRSWHLTGSDRHVSFADNHKKSKENKNNSKNKEDNDENDNHKQTKIKRTHSLIKSLSGLWDDAFVVGDSVSAASHGGGDSGLNRTTSAPPEGNGDPSRTRSSSSSIDIVHDSTTRTPETLASSSSVRLIRSEHISWTAMGSGGGTVPLTLALWDGPSRCSKNYEDLPQSLRRRPFANMPLDVFDNFSSLFGIGQHVTLTLSSQQQHHSSSQNDEKNHAAASWMVRLACAVMDRHDKQLCPYAFMSLLSSMLQTALNWAVSNCQSRIPVFGWWGTYTPQQQQQQSLQQQQRYSNSAYLQLFPPWMSSRAPLDDILEAAASKRRQQRPLSSLLKRRSHFNFKNRQSLPPLLSAKVTRNDERDANFFVSVLPGGNNLTSDDDSRLTVWGQMLLSHCSKKEEEDASTVSLCAARHVYVWRKPNKQNTRHGGGSSKGENISDWRKNKKEKDGDGDAPDVTNDEKAYRLECREHAQSLLEDVLGTTATPSEPLWGSQDDPIESVHCIVTWNGRPSDNQDGTMEPLLSLPLRIRSRHAMSKQDWIDMEDSVERTMLDPLIPSSSFDVRVHWDKDTSVTSLAASQRCLLAALVRTATLPPEILLQHLTNESITDDWSGSDEAATRIVDRAHVGALTRHLVEAMDWTSIGDHMIEPWEAEQIVKKVLDGTLTLGFPTPPEQVFSSKGNAVPEDLFAPLHKSAAAGRLLSLLFIYMSRLRDPSSMALLWAVFVRELRSRWDLRESLPNMNYVPGLDPPPEALKAKHCVSTIGLKADYAYFVHSSEPDPDDMNCLIGQKLQVFNIGIECAVALEMQTSMHFEQVQRDALESISSLDHHSEKGEDGTDGGAISVASTEVMNNATGSKLLSEHGTSDDDDAAPVMKSIELSETQSEDTDKQGEPSRKKLDLRSTPPAGGFGAIAEDDSRTSGSSKEEFFDAAEDDESSLKGTVDDVCMRGTEHTTNVTKRQDRKGARCPVHDVSLIASGDQLYAPYLQRPFPLTDDVVLERRMMLDRGREAKKSKFIRLQEQVEISQRLQKPKLHSDMRAFQAANPGAVFQDFINWYGNPGNPLDDYSEDLMVESLQPGDAARDSAAMKFDKASQAMKILTATRDFWSRTWEEATPCAAVEQPPLFDVSRTVEMVLDSLETMHPASLLNQIMAVNLSTSYFVLVTAASDTIQIGVVRAALDRLRQKTNVALDLLSRDVTIGAVSSFEQISKQGGDRLPKHASVQAIRACEAVCDAMGAAEATICRAATLLHKFPHQYEVVHNILRRPDVDPSALADIQGRNGILGAIHKQQDRNADSLPTPCLREYVLRNTDDHNPCQLCVRFGDEGAFAGTEAEGGLMVALTKCNHDD